MQVVYCNVWSEGGRLWARPAAEAGGGALRALAMTNGYAVVPADATELAEGSTVDVRMWTEVPAARQHVP